MTQANELEIRELRIGNKVQDSNGFNFDVVSIHNDGNVYCDFKGNEGGVWEFDSKNPCYGISLTEEILLKCRFENVFENSWYVEYRIDNIYTIRYYKDDKYFKLCNTFSSLVKVKHIHKLQNLYFALTGKELQINL